MSLIYRLLGNLIIGCKWCIIPHILLYTLKQSYRKGNHRAIYFYSFMTYWLHPLTTPHQRLYCTPLGLWPRHDFFTKQQMDKILQLVHKSSIANRYQYNVKVWWSVIFLSFSPLGWMKKKTWIVYWVRRLLGIQYFWESPAAWHNSILKPHKTVDFCSDVEVWKKELQHMRRD